MMLISKKGDQFYRPVHDSDLPMFQHCCEGSCGVIDIHFFMPVFNAHGVQVMIQDETATTQSKDGQSSEYRDTE